MEVGEIYSFLELLTSVPVAPFFEDALIEKLISDLPRILNRKVARIAGGIAVFSESTAKEPKIFLSAHLDHPAFHIYGNNSKEAVARKMGRLKAKNGMKIVGYSSEGVALSEGKLRSSQDEEYFSVKWNHPAFGIHFATLKIPPIHMDKKYIYCRSLDDHIGCALILSALKNTDKTNVVALLNIAEEEGMLGSLQNSKTNIIEDDDVVLSIEATPKQKEAIMGNGAVIRQGDALEKFDPKIVSWLKNLSNDLPHSYQISRPVSGNTEGAIYASFGKKVAGISIPIANYHNKNMEPESALISDVLSARALLNRAVEDFR